MTNGKNLLETELEKIVTPEQAQKIMELLDDACLHCKEEFHPCYCMADD